ncbi:monovalent cation/H+ antiporter subunit D family protein [Fretibacter rubidus]|uniref:monovalent cation/H+ antiporter subunit D family protein n=1 Tax=Fretibacter rubidus TaxID=570162 RepID=UPI00352AB2E5
MDILSSVLDVAPAWLLVHGSALIVVLPLMVAAVLAVMPSERVAWAIALMVAIICAVCGFVLVAQVYGGNQVTYSMGGWDPPHGIGYVVDGLSAPILLLISLMAVVCLLYAYPSVRVEVEPKKRAPFYAAVMVCFAGLLGMVATGDAFNVFVFLEVSSIATYVLVGMGASRDRRALTASFNYLILGSIGATFFVIGLGFLYMETGTLNMADMGRILRDLDGGSRVAQVGFAFIVIGLGLKLAMYPLHLWLPDAYAHSPSFVTAFLAATATKAALYLLLRFTFTIFAVDFSYVGPVDTIFLAGFGIIGMLLASLQAIFQTDARRALAYSSVAQVGYMLLGVGLGTAAGLAAGYIHLLNHAIIKGGLFIALGAFWYRFGITRISDFSGLGKTMPWTMAAFTISGLSLIGVPFTAGFVSKVNLVVAAWEAQSYWAIGVVVIASIMAIIYIGNMLRHAYFGQPPVVNGDVVAKNEAPLMMLIPMWILAIASIAIGTNADFMTALANQAADVLIPLSQGGLP